MKRPKHRIPWLCRTQLLLLGVQIHKWDCNNAKTCDGDHTCVYCRHNPVRDRPIGHLGPWPA